MDLPDELQAQIDLDKIQHILINILSNAIKFTPQNAKVSIRLVQINPETCRLQIGDNGTGIPSDLCETIFERFFQIEAPTTCTVGGTRLGLSIAKDFVELHGDSILAGNAHDIINAFAKPNCCNFRKIRAALTANPAMGEIMNPIRVGRQLKL
nr:ATP-binding protein [Legionella sp. PATHC039]